MKYPNMYRIRQVLEAPRVKNIEAQIDIELATIQAHTRIHSGARIGITAGSRGVAAIDRVIKHLVQALKSYGACPFIFPAMGSHGGGTAKGQLEVLESLNITQETMGAPILSSMEVVEIGRSSHDYPVYVDQNATKADGIVVVNRVKPHTDFNGPIESGLMKMMAIGMGKHKGCIEIHKQTVNYGYHNIIPEYGQIVLNALPVVFGVGIVENAYEQVACLKAVLPDNIRNEEEKLLVNAKQLMGKLPMDQIDILIVDEIGKNISGTGMDTNVIGRIMFIGGKEPETPKISRIIALDLTRETHNNACGIGLADYTTSRLVNKIDFKATAINTMAGSSPEKGRIPIAFDTDKEVLEGALNTIGAIDPVNARIVHIKNTLEIVEMEVSASLLPELEGRDDIENCLEMGPLEFDERGLFHPVGSPANIC